MKRILLLAYLLVFSGFANVAYSEVVYRDFNPDKTFSITLPSESLLIPLDFDQDGIEELSFSYIDGGTNWSISVDPSRSGVQVFETGNYVNPFSAGALISASLAQPGSWSSTGQFIATNTDLNYAGQGDKFLAVRFETNSVMHYAWLRINVDAAGEVVIVKDFAYENTANKFIIANDKPHDHLYNNSLTPVTSSVANEGNGFSIGISYYDQMLVCEKRKMIFSITNNNASTASCTLNFPSTDFNYQLITVDGQSILNNNVLLVNNIPAGSSAVVELYYNVTCDNYINGATNVVFQKSLTISNAAGNVIFPPSITVSSAYLTNDPSDPLLVSGYTNITAGTNQTITRIFELQNTSTAVFGGSFKFSDFINQTNGGNQYDVVGLQIKDISGNLIASVPVSEIIGFTSGQTFEYTFDNLHLNANSVYKIYQEVRLNICPSGNTFTSMVRMFYGCGSNPCRQINNGFATSILQAPERAVLKSYHTIDESYNACFGTSSGNDNAIKHVLRLVNEGNAIATAIRFSIEQIPYTGEAKLSLSKVSSINIRTSSGTITVNHTSNWWKDNTNWSGTINDIKAGNYGGVTNSPMSIDYKASCFNTTDLLWLIRTFNINELKPNEWVEIEFVEEFCCSEYSSTESYLYGAYRVKDGPEYNNGCEFIYSGEHEIFPSVPTNFQPTGQSRFSSTPVKYFLDLFGNRNGLAAGVPDLVTNNTYEFITNNVGYSFGARNADKNSFLWSVDLVVNGDLIPGLINNSLITDYPNSNSNSSTDYKGNIFFEHSVNKLKIYPSSIQIIDNDNDKLFQFLGLDNPIMNPVAVRAYFDIRQADFDLDRIPATIERFDLSTPEWTQQDILLMQSFINDYNIHFSVTAVCGRVDADNQEKTPDIRLVTSFYPSSNCMDCRMNLNTFAPQDMGKVRVNCPGCVTFGVLTFPTSFTRATVGNQDIDNDGLQTLVDPIEFPYVTASTKTFKNGMSVSVNDGMDLNTVTEGDIMESTSGGILWSPAGGPGQYSGDGTSILEDSNGANFMKYLVRKDYGFGSILSAMEIKVDNTYPVILEYRQGGTLYRVPITDPNAFTTFQGNTFQLIQKGGDGFLVQLPIDYIKSITDANGVTILPADFQFHSDDSFEITWYYYLSGNYSSIKHVEFIEVTTRCFLSGYPKDINVVGETDPYNTNAISGMDHLEIYANYICEGNSGIFKAADYENYSMYYDWYGVNDNTCNKVITNVSCYLDLGNESSVSWQPEIFPFEHRYLAKLTKDFEVFFPTGFSLHQVGVRLFSTEVSEQNGNVRILDAQMLNSSDYTTSPAVLGGISGTMIRISRNAMVQTTQGQTLTLQNAFMWIDDGYQFQAEAFLIKDCPIPATDFAYGYRSQNFLTNMFQLEGGPQTKIIDYTTSIQNLERTSDAVAMSYFENYSPQLQNLYGIKSQTTTINNPAVIYASKINNQFEFTIGLDVLSNHYVYPQINQNKDFSKSYIKVSSTTPNGGTLNVSSIEYSNDNGSTWLPMNGIGGGVFLLNGSFTEYKFRLTTSYECGTGTGADNVQIEYGYFCDPNVSVSVVNGVVSPSACYSSTAQIEFTPLSSAIEYVSATGTVSECKYRHRLLARSLASGSIRQFTFTAQLPAGMNYLSGTSSIQYAMNLNDTDPANDVTGTIVIADPVINGTQLSFTIDLGTVNTINGVLINNGILDFGGINSTFALEFETSPGCNFTEGQIHTSMSATSYCGRDLGGASLDVTNVTIPANTSTTFSTIPGCQGPIVTITGSERVCFGSSETLTANYTGTPSATTTYTWYQVVAGVRQLPALFGPSALNTYTFSNLTSITTFEVEVNDVNVCPKTATYTVDLDSPETCCIYKLGDVSVSCSTSSQNICIPLTAVRNVPAGIIGMDFCLKYNPAVMRYTGPTGSTTSNTLGTVVTNAGLYSASYATYNDAVNGVLRVSIYYTGNGAGLASFTGSGEIICLNFSVPTSFSNQGVYPITMCSINDLQESYTLDEKPACWSAGSLTIQLPDLAKGRMQNPLYNNAIKGIAYTYSYANTSLTPVGTDCDPQNLIPATPIVGSAFSVPVNGASKIKIQRDVHGDLAMPRQQYQLYVNGSDSWKMHRITTMDPVLNSNTSSSPSVSLFWYSMTAADVNMNGHVRANDISLVQERIVGKRNEFPQVWNNGLGSPSLDWRFVDETTVQLDASFRKSTAYPNSDGSGYYSGRTPNIPMCLDVKKVCNGMTPELYYGVMLGDVYPTGQGSNAPGTNAYLRDTSHHSSITIDAKHAQYLGNNIYRVPVRHNYAYEYDDKLFAIDLYMDYDQQRIRVNNVLYTTVTTDGGVSMMWNNTDDEEFILTSYATLDSISGTGISYYLDIEKYAVEPFRQSDFGTLQFLLNGELVDARVETGEVVTGTTTAQTAITPHITVIPNPAVGQSVIEFAVSNNSHNNRLVITDVLGRIVKTYEGIEEYGMLDLNTADLAQGMYICTIRGENGFVLTKKFEVRK